MPIRPEGAEAPSPRRCPGLGAFGLLARCNHIHPFLYAYNPFAWCLHPFLCIELVDFFDDVFLFPFGECRIAGQAELMAGYQFRHGEGGGVPFWIATLLVGRDGVVYQRLDALVGEIGLQLVSPRCHEGYDVRHVLIDGY